MHEKLFSELKTLKILIEVPSLREQLPRSNQKGADFNKIAKQLGEIYKNTVSNIFNKSGLPDVTAADNLVFGRKAAKGAKKGGSVSVSPPKRTRNQTV